MNCFLLDGLTQSPNWKWLTVCSGRLVVVLGAIFCTAQRARAGTVVYTFSGDTTDAMGAYASLSGASFTGSFTLDDSTLATYISSNDVSYAGAVTAFDVNIRNTIFSLAPATSEYAYKGPSDVNIINDGLPAAGLTNDIFSLNAGSYNYDNHNFYNSALQLNLDDNAASPTALSSTTLTGLQLNLAGFMTTHNVVRWDIHNDSSGGTVTDYWSGNITSLTSGGASLQTPEPSSLVLFGMAMAMSGGYRGWRRRKYGTLS